MAVKSDDEEKYPGHGRRLAHLELLEAGHVEIEGVEQGSVVGATTAAADDVRGSERLERTDDLQDEVEEYNRGQQRDRNVHELTKPASSIYRGGLSRARSVSASALRGK